MTRDPQIAIAIEIDRPDPHHQDVFLGILRYAREHRDWKCVIDEHPGYDPRRRPNSACYDGVIARASVPLQKRMNRLGIPMVNVHYQMHRPGMAGVYSDPVQMGRLAGEHLIDRGFPRIYGLFDLSHKHAMRLGQACGQYAEECGVPCTITDIQEGAYLVPEEWFQLEKTISRCLDMIEPPAGVVVENSEFARLFVQFALDSGLRVPQDVAVLCQDNFHSIVNVPPQISSIHTHFEAVGYEAAQLLAQLMDGSPVPDEPVFIPSRGVIGRESTDFFAVTDQLVARALQFVSTRLHEKLRVDEIAFELNVSPRLLQKRFNDAFARGVGEEIRRLRLEKAKRMLADPNLLIGSIPKAVGFATADVMNKIFKRELGMTPGEFRKKLLHSDS